jgi:hypothetical protein
MIWCINFLIERIKMTKPYTCEITHKTFENVEAAEFYFTQQNKMVKILPSGSIVTMEFRPNRVRIYHDLEDKNTIVSITFG